MSTSDNLLKACADADPGQLGDRARSRLAEITRADLIQEMHLTHARTRETVVNGTRLSLRCGALLLRDPDMARAAGISEEAAAWYLALAFTRPNLAAAATMRRGRISEAQALDLLRGGGQGHPVADLRALAQFAL